MSTIPSSRPHYAPCPTAVDKTTMRHRSTGQAGTQAIPLAASHPTRGSISPDRPVQVKPQAPPSHQGSLTGLCTSAPSGPHVGKSKRSLQSRRELSIPILEIPPVAGVELLPCYIWPWPIIPQAGDASASAVASGAQVSAPGTATSAVDAGLRDLKGCNFHWGASQGLHHLGPASVMLDQGKRS